MTSPSSPAEDPRLQAKIIAAFATIYLVWGSTFLAIRIGVRQLPPLLFGGLRFLLAGTLLAASSALWIAVLGARGPRGHALTLRGMLGVLFGGTWLVLGGLAAGELPRWEWRPGGIAAMVYLAVFGSALAYTSYSWLLKRVPADRVGTFAYVNPAVATVLGWALLGEALDPLQVAGMVVMLLGVALVTLPSRIA